MKHLSLVPLALLTACASVPEAGPQTLFFDRLSALCGETLDGRLVSNDPQDSDMAGKRMTARFGPCTSDEVRINFTVGDDSSRNWRVTRTGAGLRLKHVHLHADGSEDRLSRYGGDTASSGTALRQTFPADDFSRALFIRSDIPQSVPNVWALEVGGTATYAYELRRPGRFFRVEFDRPAAR